MITGDLADAIAAAAKLRKRVLIAQQIAGEHYFLAIYKKGSFQTANLDAKFDLGSHLSVRVWTNAEANGFDFQNEIACRDSLRQIFGTKWDKKYHIVNGKCN